MTVLPASGRPRCLWEEMKLKRNSLVVSDCVTTYQSTLVFLLPMLIFGVIALEFEFTLILITHFWVHYSSSFIKF